MPEFEPLGKNDAMHRIDVQLSHVWMVRAFLKHSEEAEDDEELREVHRGLYDYMLALGASLQSGDADTYLRLAKKKFAKLKRRVEQFQEIQPEISSHTNFQMAAASLTAAVAEIAKVLDASGE
jgi:cob(I)alamin adenosyltransferase